MKPRLVVLCALFVVAAVLSSPAQANHERTTLYLGGVTVWLGMPESEARHRFSGTGYKVLDGPITVVTNGTDSYLVKFKQGRLIYASRDWYNPDQGDELDAVLGALGALAEYGKDGGCTVNRRLIRDPRTSFDDILIFCGDRSVAIGKGTLGSKESKIDISERIGHLPPDDK
jgi:hypothetical protein